MQGCVITRSRTKSLDVMRFVRLSLLIECCEKVLKRSLAV